MAEMGQNPALPCRSIDDRFVHDKQTLTKRVQCDDVPEADPSSRSKTTQLLDDLVGKREQHWRHIEPERLRGLCIDD